uniref:Sperm associated antigen 16 n=1 Tax=Strigops habroptila TaxID=2489341 RepID=A0A672TFE2_STRHB
MDDFFCNFLVRLGMSRTLDCFQTEWYELVQRGLLTAKDIELVPTVYTRNQQLEAENMCLKKELENYKHAANKAKEAFLKMQKERDFHRMHHKRVVQEKNRLISDIKRLKAHYASYEPVLKQLTEKYQTALRQKMLTTLERDRAVGQWLEGPTQKALQKARQQKILDAESSSYDPVKDAEKTSKKEPKVCNILSSYIVVTGSDDHLWKMWALPHGNIIMTGEGHTDWLSGCCFHPSGTQLVTSSGDTTVRIWDFSKRACVLTLAEHTQAVWGCSWHSCGDFVASASMDNTSKIWDINSEKCKYTMRGHKDSVNSIEFLPFSNIVLTSSADKTLSLWDARTGLRVYTFYGHLHSCNHATFNLKGDLIASCDSSGMMKLWDIRKSGPVLSVDAGPRPANHAVFDRTGQVVALASGDGSVKVLQVASGQQSSLRGHSGEVHSVGFHHRAELLLSGGADGKVCLWK